MTDVETAGEQTQPQQSTLAISLNLQRKAALAAAGAREHTGRVQVMAMDDFDLGRTIFGGLERRVPRMFMQDKLAKDIYWSDEAVAEIEAAYRETRSANPLPDIDQRLIDFMVDDCDFSMEHADGTFLEHLVFCHDYAATYYPDHSPNIALLHSILGTATNTFAMDAAKIPKLNALLSDVEARHVAAFPSVLRLLYDNDLVAELDGNIERIDQLVELRCFRVIDNEPISLTAQDLWINLNFHLMHFVDFMPAANWATHHNDPLMQMFATLSDLLDKAGQRHAQVNVEFPNQTVTPPVGESRSMIGRVADRLKPAVTLKLARESINEYSDQIGHDLSFELVWTDS